MDSSQRAWVGVSRVETVVLIQSVAVGLGILRREPKELSLVLWPMKRLHRVSSMRNFVKVDLVRCSPIESAKF